MNFKQDYEAIRKKEITAIEHNIFELSEKNEEIKEKLQNFENLSDGMNKKEER